MFGKSLTDSVGGLPELDSQPDMITQLLAAMHRHGNLSVLQALGDAAGELTYKGAALGAEPLTNFEINELINMALAAIERV